MRKLTHHEIVERQGEAQPGQPLPLVVVLNDVRSAYNVGAIFRTADGAGVAKLYLCGITGYPPNKQIVKTALGSEKSVPWEYRSSLKDTLRDVKAEGYEVVLLEQTDQSIPYDDYVPVGPVCLVVGHEVDGISEDALFFADRAVEIAMDGLKNSLNVAVAFGIMAYHLRGQWRSRGITCGPAAGNGGS